MKKIIFLLLSLLFFNQCQETTTLQQAAILKCECLKKFKKEKGNIMECINCSEEISNRIEFKELNPILISKQMEETCPDASIPYEQIQL